MLNKVRPAGLATASRKGSASLRARKHLPNSQNREALQTTPWSWLQIGQIASVMVLPKIAAARERDRKVRAQLNLPFIDWDGQS